MRVSVIKTDPYGTGYAFAQTGQPVMAGQLDRGLHPEQCLYAAAGYPKGSIVGHVGDARMLLVVDGDWSPWKAYWGNPGGDWTCKGVDAWTRWTHRDHKEASVWVYMPSVPQDPGGLPLLDWHATLAENCQILWDFAEQVGHPWTLTAGHTAHLALQELLCPKDRGVRADRRVTPYWNANGQADPPANAGGDLIWSRRPYRSEVTPEKWIHGFDMNAARLAAMGVVEVAAGKVESRGPIGFDASMAGWWCIDRGSLTKAHVKPHKDCPPLIDVPEVGDVWVTTPIMSYWSSFGILPAVTDAKVGPSRRLFRNVAEKWNEMRLYAGGAELDALKAIYRAGCGLMASKGGLIYRPDWYHTIVDQQRVTLYRWIQCAHEQTAAWPLRVYNDCVWWASDIPRPEAFAGVIQMRLDPKALGAFKIKESRPMTEVVYRKEQVA